MADKSIKSVTIKNFKSVIETTIQLGGFNVFIGANGCGKSNILEAIALGAAASSDKMDFEYFANRGIRITDPSLLLPKFDNTAKDNINISIIDIINKSSSFDISFNSNTSARWIVKKESDLNSEIKYKIEHNELDFNEFFGSLLKEEKRFPNNDYGNNILISFPTHGGYSIMPITNLNDFMIFSLGETKLRKSEVTNRIYPLDIHGEGLFAYLKEISKRESSNAFFNELKENLTVFDWFDDIEIPQNQLSNEFIISLKDYYLDETLNTFDQRSTNEGFLYLLFYLTLIISDETPKFFAIENIDSSFNPKLCREVIRRLIVLAKKHGKQIIATTHNPSVLDGLDLEDDDVRLYTIRRTIDGDTKASRVTLKSELTIPLSEAWQRGYIGGLPNNF